jgi:fibronectin-binding autotransporter adhesin
MKHPSFLTKFLAALGILLLLLQVPLRAASQTWGNATTGNWTDTTKWVGLAFPGSLTLTNSTDTATFSNATATTVTVDSATLNIYGITFSGTPGADIIGTTGGNSLLLSSGGSILDSATNANNQTVNAPLVLEPVGSTSAGTYAIVNNNSSTGALIIGGNITGGTTTQGITLSLGGSNTSASNVVSGVISNGGATGLVALVKQGAGTWKINSSSVNTFTGGVTINWGTLNLDFANLSAPTNLIDISNALTMGGSGGTFLLTGKSNAATSQTLASLALSGGANTLQLSPQGTGTANLTITSNTISRSGGATLAFITPGNSTLSWNPSLSNGIIGPWATVGTGSSTAYATVSGGNIASFTGNAAVNGTNLTDTTGAVNYNLATANGTVQASVNANTIRYTGAVGTTAPGATLFSVNGLMNAGNGTWTIGNNTLTIGATQELVVNTANASITITGGIANNSGGQSALTKTGSNTLTLTGSNTYNGTTTVNAGNLTIASTGSLSASSTVAVNSTVAGAFTIAAGGVVGGNVTVAPSSLASNTIVANLSNNGTITGNLTINSGSTPIVVQGNTVVAGGATLNAGSSTSSGGTIKVDGQLFVAGASGVTTGTISSTGTGNGASAGTGAINITNSANSTLSFANGSSFSYLTFGNGASVNLNSAGTTSLYSYGQGPTTTSAAFTTNINSGTWNVAQVGQGNSGKIVGGTTNILGGSTFNLAALSASAWAGSATMGASQGGKYMHGIWNIGGASAGTMAITGGFSEDGGLTAVPVAGAINGLQFTVGNGGTLTTTTASTLGFAVLQTAGQTTSQVTNSLTVNSGGNVTTAGNFNVNNTVLTTTIATTNSITVNGGTFSNSGGTFYIGNQNFGNTFTETDSVTVAGGILNQTGGGFQIGTSGTAAANYANSLNISSGAMNVGNATSGQGLTVGTASNAASSTVTNTVNLSGGKLVVSGTLSAGAGANQTNTFNWTGGQLTAGTVTPSATFATPGGGGISSGLLNNTGGIFAPGDIGTGGRTTLNGAYTQGANGTLAIDLGGTTAAGAFQSANGTYDTIAMVSGALTLNGNLSVSLINGFGSSITSGNTFNIITGATSVTGSFANADAANRINLQAGGSIGISNTSSTVTLSGYSTGASLIWAGGGGNVWDINTTLNFTKAGVSSVFNDGDVTTFNNSGIANNIINLNTTVSPSVVTFANTSGIYTITGLGGIGGNGTLTVNGAGGTVVLATANSYTGNTTISAGTLKVGNATALGNAGAVSVASGAVLDLNGTTMTGTNALTLNATGISSGGALTNSNAAAGTYAGLLTLGGASSIIASAGDISLSNNGTITGSGFGLTVGGAYNTMIAGIIGTGNGTLTKQDAGTLTLTGANTYNGTTAVNGGVLNLQANGSSTSSTSVASGAALQLQGVAVTGRTLSINGTGISNDGALRGISGTNGWAGTVTLLGASRINSDSGTLALSATNSINAANQNLTLGGAGNGTVSGTITIGSGTLTKDGNGSWTLSGANTYTGGTTLTSGTLNINGAGAAGTQGPLGNNGTFTINGGTIDNTSGSSKTVANVNPIIIGGDFNFSTAAGTSNNNLTLPGAATLTGNRTITTNGSGILTLNGAISDGGSAYTLTKSGSGTLSLNGASTFSGGFFVNGGIIKSTSNPTGGSGNITTGQFGTGNLTMADNTGISWSTSLGVANTQTILNGNITLGVGSSARLTWDPGALILNGNTRTITVNATDTLANLVNLGGASSVNGIRLNKSTAAVPISLDAGSTLRFVGGGTSGTWSGLNIYEMDPFNGNSSLVIGNQLLLTFNVPTVLGNTASTYARLIVEQGGMVSLSNQASSQSQTIYSLSDGGGTGGMITNLATTAGVATLTISGNDTRTFSGTIVDGANAGTGLAGVNGVVAVTKTGSGTQILSGANTYSGNTTISTGTLLVNGSTSSNSTVNVSSGGTIGGNGTIGGATTVNGELRPGNTGLLTFGSTLTLNGATTMTIASGTSYDSVSVAGLLTYGGNLTLEIASPIASATYHLFVASTPSGNWNPVGGIAFAGGGYYTGGWSYNGTSSLWTASSSGQDFSFNKANGDLLVAAVPEPSTWALLAFSLTTVMVLRRRRNS